MRRAEADDLADPGEASPRRFGKPGPRPARKGGKPAAGKRKFGPK